ncbi:MAG: CapA family protein [Actinobacteria bacterium]|nr:CapA family protein [Actinomycetota bacterium]
MKIAVSGDLFSPSAGRLTFSQELLDLWATCDSSFVNLEGPIESAGAPVRKTGPNIFQDPLVVERIASAGLSVTLANNHIMDFGIDGLSTTLAALDARGIKRTGAYTSREERVDLELEDSDGDAVVIVNRCEAEWVQDASGAGAPVLDLVELCRTVKQHKSRGLLPILVLHGGQEMWDLPSPKRRDQARFLAEEGAAAIVYHHTHVPSAWEVWDGVPISYGLGNFSFSMENSDIRFSQGLTAILVVESGRVSMELVPTAFDASSGLVSVMPSDQAGYLERKLMALRSIVESDASLEAHWNQFTRSQAFAAGKLAMPLGYSSGRVGWGVMSRAMAPVLRRLPNELDPLLNAVRCDSHREVLTTVLEARRKVPQE